MWPYWLRVTLGTVYAFISIFYTLWRSFQIQISFWLWPEEMNKIDVNERHKRGKFTNADFKGFTTTLELTKFIFICNWREARKSAFQVRKKRRNNLIFTRFLFNNISFTRIISGRKKSQPKSI